MTSAFSRAEAMYLDPESRDCDEVPTCAHCDREIEHDEPATLDDVSCTWLHESCEAVDWSQKFARRSAK